MKVDKSNPIHWAMLIISAINIFLSMPFRIFRSRKKKRVVFFYQIDGNIKALADFIREEDQSIEMYLLAFPEYLNIYKKNQDIPTLNMLNPLDMIKVAQSDVVITNYIALTLIYYARFTSLKFVDVWHGLPMFKNQTPKIMNYLNYYTELWVSSDAMKKFYREKYKLRSKIVSTGYGRDDHLFKADYDKNGLMSKYKLPNKKKIILIAPTWQHNNPDRSVMPFGMDADSLLSGLDRLAKRTNSFIVFRSHMLSGGVDDNGKSSFANIGARPSSEYPITEELLAVSDIVITDWSSLVFDFMATGRPTIFIDAEPPFTGEEIKTRFNPNNRFGPIVKDFEELSIYLERYLKHPSRFEKDFEEKIKIVKQTAHGNKLDGNATKRYYERLKKLLV